MAYTKILHDAWDITIHNPKLKWLVFAPNFAAVCIICSEVAWHAYFILIDHFRLIETNFDAGDITQIFFFMLEKRLILWVFLLCFFVAVFGFLLPSWIDATKILCIQEKIKNPDAPVRLRQRMVEGFVYFFPLFKLHSALAPFAFLSIFFFTATVYRFFHEIFYLVFVPMLTVYFLIGLVVNIAASYAPFFIVCRNRPMGQSLKASLALVFVHLGTTLSVVMIMMLVNLRVILNALVVMAVPMLIMGAVMFFSKWVVALAIIVGVLAMALVAYISSILEIFSTVVWLRTFQMLQEKQKAMMSADVAQEPFDEGGHHDF